MHQYIFKCAHTQNVCSARAKVILREKLKKGVVKVNRIQTIETVIYVPRLHEKIKE